MPKEHLEQRSKEELVEMVLQYQAGIMKLRSLNEILENNIRQLTKPKGDGSHRCHLCHTWVNPDELYEVKADACETCMQAQLSPSRRHAENEVPEKWYEPHATPPYEKLTDEIKLEDMPVSFTVDATYKFTWKKRPTGGWSGKVTFAGVELPYLLYISSPNPNYDNRRRVSLLSTDLDREGNPVLSELETTSVTESQNHLQARTIIDHQGHNFG